MNLFEKDYRTIRTRGITLTQDQMNNFRIRRVYNSIEEPEYLNNKSAKQFLMNYAESGQFCLLEVVRSAKRCIISIIIFEDIWSRNLFALKNIDYYLDSYDLITLNN